jgi:hypothetical protein
LGPLRPISVARRDAAKPLAGPDIREHECEEPNGSENIDEIDHVVAPDAKIVFERVDSTLVLADSEPMAHDINGAQTPPATTIKVS